MAKSYLHLYNTTNALLWLYILSKGLTTSIDAVYPTLESTARYTQSLAIAEILHAALGITRAPLFTTFTQVFARCVQVWAVDWAYPQLFRTPSSTYNNVNNNNNTNTAILAYSSMLLAWSAADFIRYTYFTVLLAGGNARGVPYWLKWLRYSLFFVLYPVGIGAEWWLMLSAARVSSTPAAVVFGFCLGLYVPGAVMMYSYMVKQRRKTLR